MASTNGTNPKVISPSKLAHIVLRTGQYQEMIDFYTKFLGATITASTPGIAFLTYDDEHHRIALMHILSLPPKQRHSAGLEHIAFTFPTLTALLTSYRQRLEYGIKPVWCVNHGPTTSLYYKDVDGNALETQYDNFGDDVIAATEVMKDPDFEQNPLGVDFDPEEMWKKLQDVGENALAVEVQKRGSVGPRGFESIPEGYRV